MAAEPIPTPAPGEIAELADLVYVRDDEPGLTRRRRGKGWSFHGLNGRLITDERKLKRLKGLVIPPAWKDVWICPLANGHIQATGRDDQGRKQYIYHPRWEQQRNETKFRRMRAFGDALPALRRRLDRDLRKQGVPRERVLALAVQLLDQTHIRVGNTEYAQHDSYGLTTLRRKHLEISSCSIKLRFRGKGGKEHEVCLKDRRLAGILKKCDELPGYELFKYLDDDGKRQTIDSGDVNRYLREICGQDFTAKDFRTWGGTVTAALALHELGPADTEKEADKRIVAAVKLVAEQLNNTPAVCRQYYIHPAVLEAYRDGTLAEVWAGREADDATDDLRPEEQVVLELLERRAAS